MTRLASLRRSFPTVRLILAPFRWIGRSRRRIWCAVLVLLGMVAGPPLWWVTQLWGLPDIGEPFDIKAFQEMAIPDDRNAFVLYRQAADRFKAWDQSRQPKDSKNFTLYAPWSQADPKVRRWLDENRDALDLYRQGAERPDALDRVPVFQEGQIDARDLSSNLYSLQILALLEGSRREEQGDMAGAWIWYRAVLRAGRHVARYGTLSRWQAVQRWDRELRGRLIDWAANPRTTRALLRQALDDAVACESLAPSESYILKAEFLDIDRTLGDRKGPGAQMPPAWLLSLASRNSLHGLLTLLTREQMDSIVDAWRVLRREPERSRRVLRLVIANWLAYYDLPPEHRPKPDLNRTSPFDLYPFGPEAPAKARVLPPEVLGRWLDSTHDAQVGLRMLDFNRTRIDTSANFQEILILLGSELYHRDHGTDPPTLEALVGPYLKSLPAEYSDVAKDEAIPGARKPVE